MVDRPIEEIVCCMGQPVAGNPTQFIMERAFNAAGLDWRYLTLEVPPENLKMTRQLGGQAPYCEITHLQSKQVHLIFQPIYRLKYSGGYQRKCYFHYENHLGQYFLIPF